MLENLHDMAVEQPKTVMGAFTWGLNKEEIAMQIAKIRASLPTELKQAASLTRESEKIISNAKEEATLTVERAKKEAEHILNETKKEAERMLLQARDNQKKLIDESEVLKHANELSEEIKNAAERESFQMRRGADNYAYDVLTQIESTVGKILNVVERSKTELAASKENTNAENSPASTDTPQNIKERVRVS